MILDFLFYFDFLVCLFVRLYVSQTASVCFGQLLPVLRYAGKHIVNTIKVYIERTSLQLELA